MLVLTFKEMQDENKNYGTERKGDMKESTTEEFKVKKEKNKKRTERRRYKEFTRDFKNFTLEDIEMMEEEVDDDLNYTQ